MFDNPTRGRRSTRAEHVLRAVLESPRGLVIFALDREYRYLAFNKAHHDTIHAIWGVEISVGQVMLDVIGRDDDRARARANFDRALAGESFTLIEAYGDEAKGRRTYEDSYNPIFDQGAVVGLTVFLRDITEERARDEELAAYRTQLEHLVAERTSELAAAERRILEAERLESLGLLAGGIAHDFNNLLAGILGYADVALEELPARVAGRDAVERVSDTARRGAELTDMMLAATGQRRRDAVPTRLDRLVAEIEPLIRAAMPSRAELSLALAPATLLGDRTQLTQVVVNLVSNAAEALGRGAGEVRVSCRRADVDAARLAGAFGGEKLAPGSFVDLTISDDGVGMDAETRARVFDPFFTTKLHGRGLGLAAVFGIVRGHRGAIEVESSPAGGTRFTVLLPAVVAEVAEVAQPARSEAPPSSWSGEGTVLVADDDAVVRAVAARILRSRGFSVVEAADGPEALERLEAAQGDIKTVLLDLTMPRLTGAQTLRGIRAIAPELPVVLFSGFSEHEAEDLLRTERTYWLKKPFELSGLVEAVRHAIEG